MNKKALASLVKQASKGSVEAFSQLYNEFYKAVFYLGLKITGNEHDAGDVVQETMLCLYKDLQNIKDPNLLIAFVNRVATCRSIDILRAKKRVSAVEEEGLIFEQELNLDTEFIPQEYVERAELRQLVLTAVEELNEEHKTVVLLFYYEDLPIKEIAHILGISESLVGTRLFRARKSIKQKLERQHWGEGGVLAVAMPALSKILKLDADTVCNPQLCSQHWLRLAESSGIPGEAAAAVIDTAIASTSTPIILKASFSLYKIAVIAAASVAGTGFLLTAVLPPIREAAPAQTQQEIASEYEPRGETELLVPAASPFTEPYQESPKKLTEEDIQTPALREESVEEPLQKPKSSDPETDTIGQKFLNPDVITIRNRILSYSQGVSLDMKTILNDAGVAVAPGLIIKTDIAAEAIDTSTVNDYGLYLWAVDTEGRSSRQIAVIIRIHALSQPYEAIQ